MLGLTSPFTLPVDAQSGVDLLDYLKDSLNDVCCRLADKFGLYDRAGRLRRGRVLKPTRY